MPYPGELGYPIIMFWSGDVVFYINDVDIIKHGIRYKRLYMIPTEIVMSRYGIDGRDVSDGGDLDFNISPDFGAFVREYPAEHFHWLSKNPEAPAILMTCNFDGTESIDHDITLLKSKLIRYEDQIKSLMNENAKIREQYKVALERISALERVRGVKE